MDLKYSTEDVKKYVLDKANKKSILSKYDSLSEIAKQTLSNVYKACYRYPLRDPEVLYILEKSIEELENEKFKQLYDLYIENIKLKEELNKKMSVKNISEYLGVSGQTIYNIKKKNNKFD